MARRKNNGVNIPKPVVKMDAEGYDQLITEIAELRKRLSDVSRERPDDFIIGDWEDNAISSGYMLKNQEITRLRYELETLLAKLPYIQIVEKLNNEDLVDINDVIRVSYAQADDDEKDFILRLVGKIPELDSEIRQVSINSPMGQAIYGKQVGSTQSYTVKGNTFQITIEEKLNKKLSR